MSRPLQGRVIVVTRPEGQAAALVQRLQDLGARVLALPLIEIVPIDPNPQLDDALGALDRYDVLVVTSANAAGLLAARLAGGGASPPSSTFVVAVGEATADRMRSGGLRVDAVPGLATGAAIAQVLRSRGVAGARVLLPRARAGRPELPAALRAAGATVDDLPLYDTALLRPPEHDVAAATEADAVVLTSPSTVEALAAAAGGTLPAFRAVTIGPTTTAAARSAGITVLAEADEQSAEGLAAATVRALG